MDHRSRLYIFMNQSIYYDLEHCYLAYSRLKWIRICLTDTQKKFCIVFTNDFAKEF